MHFLFLISAGWQASPASRFGGSHSPCQRSLTCQRGSSIRNDFTGRFSADKLLRQILGRRADDDEEVEVSLVSREVLQAAERWAVRLPPRSLPFSFLKRYLLPAAHLVLFCLLMSAPVGHLSRCSH